MCHFRISYFIPPIAFPVDVGLAREGPGSERWQSAGDSCALLKDEPFCSQVASAVRSRVSHREAQQVPTPRSPRGELGAALLMSG